MKIEQIIIEQNNKLNVGDQVTINIKSLNKFPPQTMRIVKKIISNSDGKPFVISIRNEMVEISETRAGILGTATIPISAIK
jgi:hypothetical protein